MIGVDEVGRGCLAGPLLVVAARHVDKLPDGLKDSKSLSRLQRQGMLDMLSNCCQFGEGWVSAGEINEAGLAGAMRLGVARALEAISAGAEEEIIIDGHINYCPAEYMNVRALIKADSSVPLVSAASIHAKVTRDEFMAGLSETHHGYGFENHVGYGTKAHLGALKILGPIEGVHRINFAPVKDILGL